MKHEMVELREYGGPSPSSSVDCLVLLFPIVRAEQFQTCLMDADAQCYSRFTGPTASTLNKRATATRPQAAASPAKRQQPGGHPSRWHGPAHAKHRQGSQKLVQILIGYPLE